MTEAGAVDEDTAEGAGASASKEWVGGVDVHGDAASGEVTGGGADAEAELMGIAAAGGEGGGDAVEQGQTLGEGLSQSTAGKAEAGGKGDALIESAT